MLDKWEVRLYMIISPLHVNLSNIPPTLLIKCTQIETCLTQRRKKQRNSTYPNGMAMLILQSIDHFPKLIRVLSAINPHPYVS
jgi:hypothetical protein